MTKQVICHDFKGKLYKVNASRLVFRPSIYGVLIEKNKVLLSRQWDGYDFPGGGAELHETIEETLRREFWEETGLKVKSIGILYLASSFYYAINKKKFWNCQLMYFLVKRVGGKLSTANFDEFEKKYLSLAQWVDIKKVNKIKFYNSIGQQNIKLIKQALEYAK